MIKIEYVCHACLLININGKRVLTDPWIMGSCFANCLWIYPPPKKSADEIGKVDYIYFSHGHEDHFQIEFGAARACKVAFCLVIVCSNADLLGATLILRR